MKKIDLYEVALKLLGLYLIVIIINQLRDVLIYLTIWTQQQNNPEATGNFDQTPVFFVMVLGFLALVVLAFFLIFRTQEIARLISRKADFEEDLKLFSDRKTIFEICLVLLGLVTIVLTLPDFLFKVKNHITLLQNNLSAQNHDTAFLITSGIKIGIGLIAITYSTVLSGLLAKKGETDKPIG